MTEDIPDETKNAYLRLVVGLIGEVLVTMTPILLVGSVPSSRPARERMARNLERAASYLRGQQYHMAVAPQHAELPAIESSPCNWPRPWWMGGLLVQAHQGTTCLTWAAK